MNKEDDHADKSHLNILNFINSLDSKVLNKI